MRCVMELKRFQSSSQKLLFTILFALLWSVPVQAQRGLLTKATVYEIQKEVLVLLRSQQEDKERQAIEEDVLFPRDELSSKQDAQAKLSFNEGVGPVRIGQCKSFFFKPDMRIAQISKKELLSLPGVIAKIEDCYLIAMTLAGEGMITQIKTTQGTASMVAGLKPDKLPESLNVANLNNTALIAVDRGKSSGFFNLTPDPVTVTNTQGTRSVTLGGGQTVAINDGVIGEVQNFDLKKFYKTTKLAAVLAPKREDLVAKEPKEVQKTLSVLRKKASLAIKAQERWVNGLCSLNSRASASTLSTNCITTGDDPTDNFERVRELPPDPNGARNGSG